MAQVLHQSSLIRAAGHPPKTIEEYIGRVNSGSNEISIARMKSPPGWSEPGQTADFDEYTIVLAGCLHVTLRDEEIDLEAGQAVIVAKGEWVRYSTPDSRGAEYVAICIPAFAPDLVRRDPPDRTDPSL